MWLNVVLPEFWAWVCGFQRWKGERNCSSGGIRCILMHMNQIVSVLIKLRIPFWGQPPLTLEWIGCCSYIPSSGGVQFLSCNFWHIYSAGLLVSISSEYKHFEGRHEVIFPSVPSSKKQRPAKCLWNEWVIDTFGNEPLAMGCMLVLTGVFARCSPRRKA